MEPENFSESTLVRLIQERNLDEMPGWRRHVHRRPWSAAGDALAVIILTVFVISLF